MTFNVAAPEQKQVLEYLDPKRDPTEPLMHFYNFCFFNGSYFTCIYASIRQEVTFQDLVKAAQSAGVTGHVQLHVCSYLGLMQPSQFFGTSTPAETGPVFRN